MEHEQMEQKQMEQKTETKQIQKAIEQMTDNETNSLQSPPAGTPAESKERTREEASQVHRWFFTFMCMNIPIIGWIYLFYLAFSKKYPDRRSFARAYLFYKLIFLILSVLILGILIYIGLDLLDQLLAYMEML